MSSKDQSKEDKRNATPSWSGYLYQGAVGVLVALKTVADIYENDPDSAEEELAHLLLKYEYHEDFDILKDGKLMSSHQVKAYPGAAGATMSKYAKALDEFDVRDCPAGQRFLHVVQEISNWDTSDVKNPHDVKLFVYPDGKKYCSLKDDALRPQVIDLVKKIAPTTTNEVAESVFIELLYNIYNQVREAHTGGDKSLRPTVALNDVLNSVLSPNVESIAVSIDAMKLREALSRNLEEVEEDLVLSEQELGMSWNEAEAAVELFCSFEDEKLFEFLEQLHPHQPTFAGDHLLSQDGFKQVFLELIREVAGYDAVANGYLKDGESYFVTNIMDNSSRGAATRILGNPNNARLQFEGKYIVTKDLEGGFAEILGMQNATDSEQPRKDQFMKPEKVRFIKVNTAKANLKEEV